MIVVDVETSGLDYKKCSLLSIGAVDFDSPSDQFYIECSAWEGAQISDHALAINGFTAEEVRDPQKPTEGEAIKLFLNWLKEKKEITIVGQNVYFDMYFIEAAAERAGEISPLGKRIVDLHSLIYAHMLSNNKNIPIQKSRSAVDSDFIMNYVGLPPEPKPHNALVGAKFEAEALCRLLFKKNLFDELKQYNISDSL